MILTKRYCKYFKGDVPCKPNKEHGVQCDSCTFYKKVSLKILIIKLGAMGDVIRTTPILTRLLDIYQNPEIYWLTYTPDILPKEVDYKIEFNNRNMIVLEETPFDMLINLDKDWISCAITNRINAHEKRGYRLSDGKPFPLNSFAYQKYLNGIFDGVSRENEKHYVQEIFEICDIGEFAEEEYLLSNGEKGKRIWGIDKTKKVIGLNTGCSARWTARLWDINNWIELAEKLTALGYEVVLLGGEEEAIWNTEISICSQAKYFGYHPLNTFIDIVDQCDLVVSQATLGAHIAIGLKKKIVLMNNIFNPNEFHLYGRGEVIEPEIECDCYYSDCEKDCMQYIKVDTVLQTIKRLL